ncbi:MAG: hypothetical protein ACSLFH_14385 [Desulfuromonadales bacterium]
MMEITPVNEIWGVGRKLTESLKWRGIETVWQLAQMDADDELVWHLILTNYPWLQRD